MDGEEGDDTFFEYIQTHHGTQWFGPPDVEKLSETERKWSRAVEFYGFTNADDMDLVLLDAVRNGFIDVERLQKHAAALNAKHKDAHADKALDEAWSLIHNSFDDNEQEAVSALFQAYWNNIKIVTPGNLQSFVILAKELLYPDAANEIIEHYMKERSNEDRAFYDLDRHAFRSRFTDPDVLKAFDKKLATFKTEDVPAEILAKIEKHEGWSSRDIAILSKMSSEDFKKLFTSLRGPAMRTAVRTAVGFERIGNRGTEYDSIIRNARQALTEIAALSQTSIIAALEDW